MKKIITIFTLLIGTMLIAGCVSTDEINDILYAWIGATENEVILAWGLPTDTHDTEDTRFLAYIIAENVSHIAYTTPSAPATPTLTTVFDYADKCTIEFVVQDNVVTTVNHRGTSPGSHGTYCNYPSSAKNLKDRPY